MIKETKILDWYEMIQVIKADYINKNKEFMSTKFQQDYPRTYRTIFYKKYQSEGKEKGIKKMVKELECMGTSRHLNKDCPPSSEKAKDYNDYITMKGYVDKDVSYKQIVDKMYNTREKSMTRQNACKIYHKLEKEFEPKLP